MKAFKSFIVLIIITFSFSVQSEEVDPFDDSQAETNESQSMAFPRVIFSGLLDFKFIRSGKDKSYLDGGFGLSRYGGLGTKGWGKDGYSQNSFKFSVFSLVLDAIVSENLAGYVHLNFNDWKNKVGVAEALISYKRASGNKEYGARFGALFPPFSLEHGGTAWSTTHSITPSAINTWIGEELKIVGLEMSVNYRLENKDSIQFLAAGFSGNDVSGAVLSWRGWAMHDFQSNLGENIPAPHSLSYEKMDKDGWIWPFKEIDGNIGAYGKLSYESPDFLELSFFYYHSMAEANKIDVSPKHIDYAWNTSFWNLGLKILPLDDSIEILGQFLHGQTRMGQIDNPGVKNNYWAAYILGSLKLEKHRFTGRYDKFGVEDKDSWWGDAKTTSFGSPISESKCKNAGLKFNSNNTCHVPDLNESSGEAYTFAYLYEFNDFHVFAIEYLMIKSSGPGGDLVSTPGTLSFDPDDNLLQILYRLKF